MRNFALLWLGVMCVVNSPIYRFVTAGERSALEDGPGSLLICGGGKLPAEITDRFVQLAGGKEGRLVVIPTATSDQTLPKTGEVAQRWIDRGLGTVSVLHTRKVDEAKRAEFVEPLCKATAVWISGGNQSRLAQAYLGTEVERELKRLLQRGGVIGGTSAGAAIMSKVMIAGGKQTPKLAMGFDLAKHAIVDQHFLRRNRFARLLNAVGRDGDRVGLGVDEGTALLLQGTAAEVLGRSYVVVISQPPGEPLSVRTLHRTQKLDLATVFPQGSTISDPKNEPVSELPKTGAADDQLASFDRLMQRFVPENKIPGAALAVAKDGRLVYARGFGYADVHHRQPVQPDSLFRIASISKPITAAAILQLIDQQQLKLDDRVFEILPEPSNSSKDRDSKLQQDPRLKEITIRHLLQHTGGWDRDLSIDPMFHSVEIAHRLKTIPPAGARDVIRFMRGWELDFAPGSRYAYSNFGYCLLGRTVEKVTGKGYQQHVRESMLASLGIESMKIGKTLLSGRTPGEVRYYTPNDRTGTAVFGPDLGAKVPRPYGAWHLEAMDSHGGWIASAIDIVRFGSAIQHNGRSKILSPNSRQAMFARPEGDAGYHQDGRPKKRFYNCGWFANEVEPGKTSYWHTGHLPGTSTILVLRHDGLCWAALFNIDRTADDGSPSRKIDPLLHQAADAVEQWPKHDLFSGRIGR